MVESQSVSVRGVNISSGAAGCGLKKIVLRLVWWIL